MNNKQKAIEEARDWMAFGGSMDRTAFLILCDVMSDPKAREMYAFLKAERDGEQIQVRVSSPNFGLTTVFFSEKESCKIVAEIIDVGEGWEALDHSDKTQKWFRRIESAAAWLMEGWNIPVEDTKAIFSRFWNSEEPKQVWNVNEHTGALSVAEAVAA